MVRLGKANPFKHETTRETRRRLKHNNRHERDRHVLESLLRGDVQPSLTVQPSTSSEAAAVSYGYADDLPYNEFDPNSHRASNLLEAEAGPLSRWESIPWTIESSKTSKERDVQPHPAIDPQISAALRAHDRRVVHQTRANNWKNVMNKLFTAYLWLKNKTANWTNPESFNAHTAKFCKCEEQDHQTACWIDQVDLVGQQRVKIKFCRCMPRSVFLLTLGYLPSSPLEPSTGFSMRMLAYYDYSWQYSNVRLKPFTQAQKLFGEERSEVLWNNSQTEGRELGQCLSSAVLVYRELLGMNHQLLESTLGLTNQQKMAANICPACFGPSMNTGLSRLSAVKNRLILSLDGNFQHRHQKSATKNHIPLITPEIFVQPSELQEVLDMISVQESLHKVRKKADRCVDSHKAANDTRNETTWKACDDTGLMGSCCRHDSVIYLANIHGTGENRALPLTILKRILSDIEPDRPVGVLYDIGCSLDKYIKLRHIFPEAANRLNFGTSIFHAYVHEWPCQLRYNPRYQKGWGLSDGESCERLWSALSPQVSPLRYATRNNRLAALAHRCKFLNRQGRMNLIVWLLRKFDHALNRRDTAKDELIQLTKLANPHMRHSVNYSVEFFRTQWEDQVRVGLESGDSEAQELQKKKLAEFFENEEVLESYRDRLISGNWPTTWVAAEQLLASIDQREAKQQELAAYFGKSYTDLKGARKTEQGLLSLLWKAKTDLYAQAVAVQSERQPLRNASAGNILGTRLKERILAAIKRRKAPVEKVIKNFNQRRTEYFKKCDPARLNQPENQDLTYASFLEIKLDDPLWSDGHFYHAQAPWATDPRVRQGINAVLTLDRVEEEVELLTQELDRAMSWAHEYWKLIRLKLLRVEMATSYPDGYEDEFALILPNFPTKGKLRLLLFELQAQLVAHEKLMVGWMEGVDVLWNKTRTQDAARTHPWFDIIGQIKSLAHGRNMAIIEDALERMDFEREGVEVEREDDEEAEATDLEAELNGSDGDEAGGQEQQSQIEAPVV